MKTHKNNIGLIRLVLAALVIIGHSPEIIDGNRDREPLTVVFHSLSLGEIAVDGFFLLSGFLITASMVKSANLAIYFWRRIMRIVPAFLVAFLLCVFVLAPLVGGHPLKEFIEIGKRLLTLRQPPQIPGSFDGLPNTALDGSLWSIAYEFRCYVLVALLWAAGLLNRRKLLLVLTATSVLVGIGLTFTKWDSFAVPDSLTTFIGTPQQSLRLTTTFMVGTCAYLFWPELQPSLTGRRAVVCAIIALVLLFSPHLAEAGFTIFAAYALFWLAMKADIGVVQSINDRWDISYGVYLYGWPVTMILLWLNRGINPWQMIPAALAASILVGVASWYGIEKWTKGLGPIKRPRVISNGS